MNRIGITGAFGFLGASFVTAILSKRNAGATHSTKPEIVAFASKTKSNPLFPPSAVITESLDIMDSGSLAEKFRGLDVLAHFAGKVDYRRAFRREVWDTDVLGTKRVFEAALAAKVKKILYVSSICALGPGNPPQKTIPGQTASRFLADENSTPYGNPGWPISFSSPAEALEAIDASERGEYGFLEAMNVAYFDAKLAGWELAKHFNREKGLPIVTIFPGTAVGPGDLHNAISKFVNKVWEGKLRLAPRGVTAFMDSRDLGNGALLALRKGRIGEAYVLAGRDEHSMSYTDFMKLICGVAQQKDGRRAVEIFSVPLGLSLAAASITEGLVPMGSLTRALILSGSVSNACTSAKAMRDLGYSPRANLEDGILACRNFRH